MIIEKQLESQLIAALRSDGDGVYWSGAWSVADNGFVKGDESSDTGAVVAVTVQPRAMPDYGGGFASVEADFGVSVSCSMSADADPTGAKIVALWESISGKVWRWVVNQTSEQETELTVKDADDDVVFAPGGVMQNGGTAPTYVGQAHMWNWSISFTVKGIITE